MNEALEKRILEKLQLKIERAAVVAGGLINTLSDAATPVHNETLRESKGVRVNGWNDIDVFTGGPEVAKYVGKQYGLIDGKETPLHHEGDPVSGYKDLAQGGADGGGTGDAAQYSRQYRAKKKSGVLTPSVPKWYHRVIQDSESLYEVMHAFVERFKR